LNQVLLNNGYRIDEQLCEPHGRRRHQANIRLVNTATTTIIIIIIMFHAVIAVAVNRECFLFFNDGDGGV
jgi:hypothetical protein